MPNEVINLYVPFYVRDDVRFAQRQNHSLTVSGQFIMFQPASKPTLIDHRNFFATELSNANQLTASVIAERLNSAIGNNNFIQAGKDVGEATILVNQHSWYKLYQGVVFVVIQVPKNYLNYQSEKDIHGDLLNAGVKSYPVLTKNISIKPEDILSIYVSENRTLVHFSHPLITNEQNSLKDDKRVTYGL